MNRGHAAFNTVSHNINLSHYINWARGERFSYGWLWEGGKGEGGRRNAEMCDGRDSTTEE
eukprot:749051-Hanusia_phi.AAC.1